MKKITNLILLEQNLESSKKIETPKKPFTKIESKPENKEKGNDVDKYGVFLDKNFKKMNNIYETLSSGKDTDIYKNVKIKNNLPPSDATVSFDYQGVRYDMNTTIGEGKSITLGFQTKTGRYEAGLFDGLSEKQITLSENGKLIDAVYMKKDIKGKRSIDQEATNPYTGHKWIKEILIPQISKFK